MNRIQSLVSAVHAEQLAAQGENNASLFSPTEQRSRHTVFVPQHYEGKYPYPLIVWLHGPGNDERQLLRVMPRISMRNYVGVAPRGPLRVSGPNGPGFTWQTEEDAFEQVEQRIFAAIEAAGNKYHIGPERVFLAGFDLGGTVAFRVGMNHPERFAGILSVGGSFPRSRAPLWRLDEARRVPVFVANGRESRRYPSETICRDLRLMHSAGMDITVRLYPSEDEMTGDMLRDMDGWIMEQVTGQPATTE